MPYPSPDILPAPTDEPHESVSYQQTQEFAASEEPIESPKDNQDLFHGTEALLDALPRLWTRGVLYTLIGFVALALPWAMLFQVDETGSAKGRIEPQGATQKLDSPTGGSVKTVMAKEGDTVKAGQVLLELESDILRVELQEAQAKLSGLLNQQGQLDILVNQLRLTLNVQERQNQSQLSEKISLVNQAQQNLELKQSTYNLQKLEKEALVNQAEQQIRTAEDNLNSAIERLKIDARQVQRFNRIVKEGAVSVTQIDQLKKEEQESKRLYKTAEAEVKQTQLRLAEETSRYQSTINQLQSDIKQAKLQLQQEKNSYKSLQQAAKLASLKIQEQIKDVEAQVVGLKSQIAQTRSQIISLGLQMQQRVVRSPTDGVIFELPFTKAGAVVQPGQRIAQIAPNNANFILRANIASQDSGFLKLRMPVKIKFDAYPFQEYGIVPGKVTWISPDSKVSQTPQGNSENYELEITLEQQYIQHGNKRIYLSAGQTANAEIIIRQRRVIDFILEPFQKLQTGE